MAFFKCKMCGGELTLTEGSCVAQCEYCGSLQTVPNADDEKKIALFARANRLRFGCEFDKAAGIYEAIVADFPEEPEAYWGLVLCKFGIEYVEDPASKKRIPTCHRSSFTSIMDDTDYEQTLENADATARKLYREEAKQIEAIRKGVLEVSSKEEPYDIFICYKETGEDGKRTLDSVLAQDIYDALTAKNYRVFFSRITLEDKLGQEYEPYIFAALNSAKVMLVIGTDYEYFNAVWVRNEWSRYLKLMEEDHTRHLIPCYKGIDAYDMPKEFLKLQAQDLDKIGATQELLRGIDKLIKVTPPTASASKAKETADLLALGTEALEKGEWAIAVSRFDLALTVDPLCAEAYVGKLMAERRCKKREQLAKSKKRLNKSAQYKQAIMYAGDSLKAELEELCAQTVKRFRHSMIALFVSIAVVLGAAFAGLEWNYHTRINDFYSGKVSAKEFYNELPKWEWYRQPDNCTKHLLQHWMSGTYPEYEDYSNLVIPNGVTELGEELFANCEHLKAITIPDSVITIGPGAFEGCKNLESITIPDSVTSIGYEAFAYCPLLTSVTIPDSVVSLGDSAFYGCTRLYEVKLSNKLQRINARLLSGCSGVTSLKIPDSVTEIGNNAFSGCTALAEIKLPGGLTSIGSDAFYHCRGLRSIPLPSKLTYIGENAFEGCTALNHIDIPDGLTTIANRTFKDCVALTEITIPNSVTSIGKNAFIGCSELKEVAIPDSVTDIGRDVFNLCSSLTKVTLSDGITEIGDRTFYGCEALEEVTIPAGVTKIGMSAFGNCPNLKHIYYTGTKTQWNAIQIGLLNDILNKAQLILQ